eukprot:2767391-Rhodomonas_salina.1
MPDGNCFLQRHQGPQDLKDSCDLGAPPPHVNQKHLLASGLRGAVGSAYTDEGGGGVSEN